MNKLFLDVGNTRVKMALANKRGYELLPAVALTEFLTEDGFGASLSGKKVDAVYITSVTSHENLEILKLRIQKAYQLFPVILSAQPEACGLVSGYDSFYQLGDDRWMAMQGAVALYQEPVIVISAGTAMTLDAVKDGKHLGGFIVPGLDSLRNSLANDTAALSKVDLPKCDSMEDVEAMAGGLARRTDMAILGGTLYMTVAYLNAIISDLNCQMAVMFKVVFTGGNAQLLSSLIEAESEVISDLVLQGMMNIEKSVKNN